MRDSFLLGGTKMKRTGKVTAVGVKGNMLYVEIDGIAIEVQNKIVTIETKK